MEYFAALSQHDSTKLADLRAPIKEYNQSKKQRQEKRVKEKLEPDADWYQVDALESKAADVRRWAVERKLMRATDFDPFRVQPDRLRAAHARLLERVDFVQKLYDVAYPFVEPPQPLSSQERFRRGFGFLKDMGCLQCHVLGSTLPGPAKTTDDFVQMYRLDGVRGEGDEAVALLNGQPHPVGSVIDGHTLVSAENVYYDMGDVETKAVFEGPGAEGQPERILLVAPSAPNLSLTYQRLRRSWVHAWMLQPQWIQPGTKMPQNFPDGVSPFEGDSNYPGTAVDHINLLVDFLYHAGATNTRAEMAKLVVSEEEEAFEEVEGAEFDEEKFDKD